MRIGTVYRKTKETDIKVTLNLDVVGENKINTGIGFFDHMLTSLAVHSGINLDISAVGDLIVDGHHTVEDVGISLGKAFADALMDKNGITRYGDSTIPMDEALVFSSLDISGRPYLVFNASFPEEMIGDFSSCLVEEFFRAFSYNAGITLHINILYGKNTHHMCEAIFKSVAHSLKKAVKITDDIILSTKGTL